MHIWRQRRRRLYDSTTTMTTRYEQNESGSRVLVEQARQRSSGRSISSSAGDFSAATCRSLVTNDRLSDQFGFSLFRASSECVGAPFSWTAIYIGTTPFRHRHQVGPASRVSPSSTRENRARRVLLLSQSARSPRESQAARVKLARTRQDNARWAIVAGECALHTANVERPKR